MVILFSVREIGYDSRFVRTREVMNASAALCCCMCLTIALFMLSARVCAIAFTMSLITRCRSATLLNTCISLSFI